MTGTIYVSITGILLTVAFTLGQANKGDKSCAHVKCIETPPNLKCTQVLTKNNNKAPAPFSKSKRKLTKCCPLWECREKNKKGGKAEFRTFHGQKESGGTETVHYQSTQSRNGKPIYNVVNSMATGKHDSTAVASDSKASRKEIMKEMEDSFKGYGLKI